MGLNEDFKNFWAHYPLKVGKLAALASYQKALKRPGVTHARLLEAVERYKAGKPGWAEWCHAKTWLNQGRWDDEYAPDQSPASDVRSWCQHARGCPNREYHEVLTAMEQRQQVKT